MKKIICLLSFLLIACDDTTNLPPYMGDAAIMPYVWDDSVSYTDPTHTTSRWVIQQPVVNGEVQSTPFEFSIQYLGGDPFTVLIDSCEFVYSSHMSNFEATEFQIVAPYTCEHGSFTVRNSNNSVLISNSFPSIRVEMRNDDNTWSLYGFAEPL